VPAQEKDIVLDVLFCQGYHPNKELLSSTSVYDEIVENNSPAPTIYNHVSIVICEEGEEK